MNSKLNALADAGESGSFESTPALLVVLRHDLGKLPAGIAIRFPREVALTLIHQRYAVPVADFESQADLAVDEDQLMYADLPASVIPLGAMLESVLIAA